MNARGYLCLGRASHSHRVIRSELLILTRGATSFALTRCMLRCLCLLLSQQHQLEFLNLRIQLIEHVFLHGQHLVLYLHLLL